MVVHAKKLSSITCGLWASRASLGGLRDQTCFHKNAKVIFHCVNICTDGTKAMVGFYLPAVFC